MNDYRIKEHTVRIVNVPDEIVKKIRADAIDKFAEKLKKENKETIPTHSGYCRMNFEEVVDEIANQLKKDYKK